MRRVMRSGRVIKEERFVGRYLFAVRDELDRFVRNIFSEVISLLGRSRRFDLMIVINKIGIVLMCVATEETVVAFEAAAQRPAIVRAGRTDLVGRSQVPFADAVGRVTVFEENFG